MYNFRRTEVVDGYYWPAALSFSVHCRCPPEHLEKVPTLLTPSENYHYSVSSLKCRKSRVYFDGERPDIRLQKVDLLDQHPPAPRAASFPISSLPHSVYLHQGLSDSRVRIYSVGSRGGPVGRGQQPQRPFQTEFIHQFVSERATSSLNQVRLQWQCISRYIDTIN